MADAEYKELDIDDSFDFDDDLDMDVGMDDELNPPPIRDDRNVITKTSEKFAQSAMGEVVNPSNLSKMLRNALPREMQEVHSLADDGLSTVKQIYDETTESLKQPVKALKRSLRSAKAVMGKVLPDRIDKWLDGILEDDEDSSYMQETKEQMQENQIAAVLAENFKWQAEKTQEEKAREEIQAVTDTELNRKQAEFLARGTAGIQRLNDYNDGPNLGYQRKMLEINYRQLFAQQGMYEEIKFIRSEFIAELRSITKNTSLPDLVKQKNREVMKDISLRRLIDLGQKSAGSILSSYFGKMGKNFQGMVRGKVDELKQVIDMAIQGADAYGQFNDPSMRIGEAEIIESDSHRLARGAASFAGQLTGSAVMSKIGSSLQKLLEKNPWIRKQTQRVGVFSDNPQFYINRALRRGIVPEAMRNILPEWLANTVDDLGRELNPGLREESGSVGYNTLKNINEPTEFDNRTKVAITDIIPGYLARILQSSEGIRVGTPQPMLVYSHERTGFVTSNEITKDMKAKLFNQYDKERIERSAKDQRKLMLGDMEMSKEEEELFEKAMLYRARNFKGADIEDLMDDAESVFGKEVPKELREKWQKRIAEEFGYDKETKKVKDEEENYQRIRKLQEEAFSLTRSLPSLIEKVKELNEGGLNYMEVLKELGLVQETRDGIHQIKNDEYYKQLREGKHKENEEESKKIKSRGSSTVSVGTIPTGAKKLPTRKPKGLLNGINQNNARPLRGGDVLSTLIDLRDSVFTLRDHLLSRREDTPTKSTMQTNYETLYEKDQKHREGQTTRIVDAIENQSRLFKLELGNLGVGFERALNSTFAHLSNAMDKLMIAAGNISIDEAMLAKWEKYKEMTKSGYQKGTEWVAKRIENAGRTIAAVPGKLKNTAIRVGDAIGDTSKFLFQQAKKPIAGIADLFSAEIREDIYVMKAGTLTRALTYANLVAGVYFDKVTGKTLEKFEKIKHPIMERQANGTTVREVLSEEDIKNGLYNIKGEKFSTSRFKGLGLKAISFAKDKIEGALKLFSPLEWARKAKQTLVSTAKTLYGLVIDDIYVGDETTPRIHKRAILNGEYQDAAGNILSPRHFENLSSDIYVKDPTSPNGRTIILTLAEASEKGLFDSKHRPYKALMGKIKAFLKKPWELAKKGLTKAKELTKGLVNTVFNMGKFLKRGLTLDMYPKFIYELLAWKFGAPEHHQEALKGNSLFALPTKLFKRVKDFFNKDKANVIKEAAEEKYRKAKEKLLNIKESGQQLKDRAKALKDKATIENAKREARKAAIAVRKARRNAKKKIKTIDEKYGGSAIKRKYNEAKAKVEAIQMKDYIEKAKTKAGIRHLISAGKWTKAQTEMTWEERKEQLRKKKEELKKKLQEKKDLFALKKEKAKEKFEQTREKLKEKRISLANRIGGWRHSLRKSARRAKKKTKLGFFRGLKRAKSATGTLLLGAIGLIGTTLLKLLQGTLRIGTLIKDGFVNLVKSFWDLGGTILKGLWNAGGKAIDGVVDGAKWLKNGGAKAIANKTLEWGGKALAWGDRALTAAGAMYTAAKVGVGGWIMSTALPAMGAVASSAMSGIAATTSFLLTNPIGWAVLAIAGGYTLWNFFRDKFEPMERFRIMAYGLLPDEHEDQANRLLAFEKEVYANVRWAKEGEPTLDEIDYQKWAGFFWSEESGQPNQNNWPGHVQRFTDWFNARFKPTFLRHIKNLRRLDPSIEPLEMDDDLGDEFKSSWARSVFFEKTSVEQTPYDYVNSPFSDIQILDAHYELVKRQRDILVDKYQSDEDKMKRKAKGEKTWWDYTTIGMIQNAFGDSQTEADKKLRRMEIAEKFKDAEATVAGSKGGKDDMLTGSMTKVTLKNADGTTKEVNVEDVGYKISESVNEFEFLCLFLLGMPEEISKADYKAIKEFEFKLHEDLVLVGKQYGWRGQNTELVEKYATLFGWSLENDSEKEAFANWVVKRMIPFVCEKKRIAMSVNKNVDYVRMDVTLEYEELQEIMAKLVISKRARLDMTTFTTFLRSPYRPFKNLPNGVSEETFNKWYNALKNRKGKNLFKTLTPEEKEKQIDAFKKGAKEEMDRRAKAAKGLKEAYQEEQARRVESASKWQSQTGDFVRDTGYGQVPQMSSSGQSLNMGTGNGGIMVDPTGGNILNVGTNGQNYEAIFQGSGNIRGISWQPRGEFLNPLQKGNPLNSVERNYALVKDLIPQVAAVAGVDAGLLAAMGHAESGFNANAGATTGTSAKGMYQFTNAAWTDMTKVLKTKYGIESPQVFNPVHNTLGAAELIKQSITRMKPAADKAGVPVDATLLYASHFMGPTGVKNFLEGLATRPDTPITTSLSEEAARKNGALTSLGKEGPPYKNHVQLYNALRKKMYGDDVMRYVEDARKGAGMAPKQVSDAIQGQSQLNPNYQPSEAVSVGSGGSMANPNYDLRNMPTQNNVSVGGESFSASTNQPSIPQAQATMVGGPEARMSAPAPQGTVSYQTAQNYNPQGQSFAQLSTNQPSIPQAQATMVGGPEARMSAPAPQGTVSGVANIASGIASSVSTQTQTTAINATSGQGQVPVPLAAAADNTIRMKHNVKVKSQVPKLLAQCTPELEQLGRTYAKARSNVDLNGMEDIWMKLFYNCVGDFVKSTGSRMIFDIYSGYRSAEKQRRLYEENIKNHPPKGNGKVAAPGRSRHEFGVALDIHNTGGIPGGKDFEGGILSKWEKSGIAGKWGFWRRLRPGVNKTLEDWHVENKFFLVNGVPASGQTSGDGEIVNTAMNDTPVASTLFEAAQQASGNVPVGSPETVMGGGLFGGSEGSGLPVNMSRQEATKPLTSQDLMNGAQGNMTQVGSGVMSSDVGQPATMPASGTMSQSQSSIMTNAQSFNPGASQPQQPEPTIVSAQPTQTSVQQAMGQQPVDNTATQVQQQVTVKVDKELVTRLEDLSQKQLDALLSIDGKFDKLIENVAGLAKVQPTTPEEKKETPVGSSRTQMPQVPVEVPKGPLSTQRPRARE